MLSYAHAPHLKHFLLELRGIFHVDLQKQDRHVLWDAVVLSLILQLPGVLFGVVCEAAAVGDDVDLIPLLASTMNLLASRLSLCAPA
jgi:hypothetical protein